MAQHTHPAADPTAGGAVIGADGLGRCPWALSDPQMTAYHDTEWGVPVRTEHGLFERLCLEAFQAGLSWSTVLRKRDALRGVFHDFDPDAVAAMTDDELDVVLTDRSVIRNRAKVYACRDNARAVQRLRTGPGLAAVIWAHRPEPVAAQTADQVPTRAPESAAMAAALRGHGLRFVGPVSCFALAEAAGLVDTHLLGCHRRGAGAAAPR